MPAPFLLNLESLKETVVDCFVQQNVMTISIETEFDLQSAIDPMVPALKQSLKEMGYSLSGVVAKKGSLSSRHSHRTIYNEQQRTRTGCENMKEQTPLRKAVALHYDEQKDKAPKVIATGRGHIAENIIAEAKKQGYRFRKIGPLSN